MKLLTHTHTHPQSPFFWFCPWKYAPSFPFYVEQMTILQIEIKDSVDEYCFFGVICCKYIVLLYPWCLEVSQRLHTNHHTLTSFPDYSPFPNFALNFVDYFRSKEHLCKGWGGLHWRNSNGAIHLTSGLDLVVYLQVDPGLTRFLLWTTSLSNSKSQFLR